MKVTLTHFYIFDSLYIVWNTVDYKLSNRLAYFIVLNIFKVMDSQLDTEIIYN